MNGVRNSKYETVTPSNASLTVVHNGVEIYKLQEVGHTTTASPVNTEGPNPLPLYIQDHGHDLFFRNIWVVER